MFNFNNLTEIDQNSQQGQWTGLCHKSPDLVQNSSNATNTQIETDGAPSHQPDKKVPEYFLSRAEKIYFLNIL